MGGHVFSAEEDALLRQFNGLRKFSLIIGDGDIVATLSIWHTSDVAYARLWDVRDNPSYEVGISKEILMRDKNALEAAITDMLEKCGMKFFTLQDEIAATSSSIASLV